MEELKMLLQLGGPTAVLAWLAVTMVKEIRPALDRNTQAFGAVAQLLAEKGAKLL